MNNILAKVIEKHNWLAANKEKYGIDYVVMSMLVGSQNYHLDSNESDVDVYSLIFPKYENFIKDTNLINFEHEFEDGSKIVAKDARLIFNLLRKPSPNSIECFTSHYKVYNPLFEKVLEFYLDDDYTLYYLTHANYTNMVNAIAGCAHGVHGRNMTIGKQYSHILRLHDMLVRYLDRKYRPCEYLELDLDNLHLALATKFNLLPVTEQSCQNLSDTLFTFAKNFTPTVAEKTREVIANKLIDDFQVELTEIYLEDAKSKRKRLETTMPSTCKDTL